MNIWYRTFNWDAETGEIWWKTVLYLNGKRAFNSVSNDGYLYGNFDGRRYFAHRVIWFLHYGEWPKLWLDHRDRDRKHNAIDNLREATPAQNSANAVRRSVNKGFMT